MNAQRTIEKVTAMLYAYDKATGHKFAPEILQNPVAAEAKFYYLDFYGPAAEIIAAARADLAKKAGSPVNALKRIANAAIRDELRGVSYSGDYSYVISGFHGVKIPGKIDGLPAVPGADSIPGLFDSIKKDVKNRYNITLNLPQAADIKAFIAANGLRRNSKARPDPFHIDAGIYCNPFYLLDIIEALPGCIAYGNGPTDLVYFTSPAGDGVLCPVRLPRSGL